MNLQWYLVHTSQSPAHRSELEEALGIQGIEYDDNTISFTLLLRYSDDSGLVLVSDILSSMVSATTPSTLLRQAAGRVMEGCFINIVSRRQQEGKWKRSMNAATPIELLHVNGRRLNHYSSNKLVHKVKGWGHNDVVLSSSARGGDTHRQKPLSHLHRYPSIEASWNRNVPEMPNYCGLADGTLPNDFVSALQAHHEAAFIETKHKEKKIPLLDKILKGCMMILLNPLLTPVMDMFGTHSTHTISTQLGHDIQANVGPDTLKMLEPILYRNLTAILTDSITAEVSQKLAGLIDKELSPRVIASIVEAVEPELHSSITKSLEGSLPSTLGETLAFDISRLLPISLSKTLSKTVTHSIVPTLTHALAYNKEQEDICVRCYYTNEECSRCNDSPEANYHTSYYSAYYSDYYAS